MILIGFLLISICILTKYKPTYRVIISGEKIGYIDNKKDFEEKITKNIKETSDKNIDSFEILEKPEYTLGLVEKKEIKKEEEILEIIKENTDITYKYYEIAVSNITIDSVDTLEEAQNVVNGIKSNEENKAIDLSIIEKYTNNEKEINTKDIEIAKENVLGKVGEEVVAKQKEKEEQERINAMPIINGIRIAQTPVKGTLTSRYAEKSSIRSSTHTGLDIASPTGTPIETVADGTIIAASYAGAYGNMIKVEHGNGLETWYAHTSKMYVRQGQKVTAGEIIAAVGSTGNSTGAHLHLEIRINGQTVNPQKYLYK